MPLIEGLSVLSSEQADKYADLAMRLLCCAFAASIPSSGYSQAVHRAAYEARVRDAVGSAAAPGFLLLLSFGELYAALCRPPPGRSLNDALAAAYEANAGAGFGGRLSDAMVAAVPLERLQALRDSAACAGVDFGRRFTMADFGLPLPTGTRVVQSEATTATATSAAAGGGGGSAAAAASAAWWKWALTALGLVALIALLVLLALLVSRRRGRAYY